MTGKFQLELTRSQQMALMDLISEFIANDGTEEFIDCSQSPAVVTTPGQLILLVNNAKLVSDEELKARIV